MRAPRTDLSATTNLLEVFFFFVDGNVLWVLRKLLKYWTKRLLNSQRTSSVVWRNDHKIRADSWSWGKRPTASRKTRVIRDLSDKVNLCYTYKFRHPCVKAPLRLAHVFYYIVLAPVTLLLLEIKILRESITVNYLSSYLQSLSCG